MLVIVQLQSARALVACKDPCLGSCAAKDWDSRVIPDHIRYEFKPQHHGM
jgi:hypothetical protein